MDMSLSGIIWGPVRCFGFIDVTSETGINEDLVEIRRPPVTQTQPDQSADAHDAVVHILASGSQLNIVPFSKDAQSHITLATIMRRVTVRRDSRTQCTNPPGRYQIGKQKLQKRSKSQALKPFHHTQNNFWNRLKRQMGNMQVKLWGDKERFFFIQYLFV